MSSTEEIIDFVIVWVDGSDSSWKNLKRRYKATDSEDDREERYRDWGLLKYWFRGVEKYAPWVNKIHFVTCGQVPEWLNRNHPKLVITHHSDFLPEEYLPTFNSHTIELNLHRITGLSEHFVYFNDDMYLIRSVSPKDFFRKGLPCDLLAFQPIVVKPENLIMARIYLNNSIVIAKHFDKRKNVMTQPFNYFKPGYPLLYFCYNLLELAFPLYTGMYTQHGPSPLCRQTYIELWELEKETLDETSRRRIRCKEDINQYLLREWQKLSGKFHAENIERKFRYYEITEDNTKLVKTIRKQRVNSICINDCAEELDYIKVRQELQKAFQEILPEKSDYELL